jgi:hypothetical protein
MMIDKKMTAGRPITIISRKHAILILPPAIAIFIFTGCWTPPNANVQLRGEARLIQNGVSADDNNVRATVQSVDANQRIFTCTVGTQGADFGKLQQGDHVKVTLAEKLAVYVLNNGKLPAAGGIDETIPFIARVQLVDPSYRLLTLQYLNGHTEVLKAGLDAKLLEMHPGDAVVLESAVARSIRIEKP